MRYIQPADSLWGVPTAHITRSEIKELLDGATIEVPADLPDAFLTRYNMENLLAKLDNPDSNRFLMTTNERGTKPRFVLVAVEN